MAKKLFRYNLYLKWPRDREIIDWLDAQESASRAIRERLLRTFEDTPVEQPGGVVAIDATAVQEAVVRALDARRLTLPGVRQVVEAALREALSGLAVAGETPDADEVSTDDWMSNLDEMILD